MECFSNSCKNKVKMVCKTWEDGSTLIHCCVLNEHLSAAFVSTKQVFQLTRPKKSSFSNSFSLSPPLLKCHATALEWVRIHIHVCVWAVRRCHPFYCSICTTSWKRATLLFTCLPAMLHRGLIRGVDRSCNLKRGHCSSEQKQLKENERRPPRVKNRKLSTCMLESTTPHPPPPHHLPHQHPHTPPLKLTGPALLCMIRSASSSSKLLVTFWLNEVQLRRELGSSC